MTRRRTLHRVLTARRRVVANRAALQSASTMPIVTAAEADPVGNGFTTRLAHPIKSITGVATMLTETVVKNPADPAGTTIVPIDASTADEIERAIAAMPRERVQAFTSLPDAFFTQQQRRFAQLALKHRRPASSWRAEFVDAGGPIHATRCQRRS